MKSRRMKNFIAKWFGEKALDCWLEDAYTVNRPKNSPLWGNTIRSFPNYSVNSVKQGLAEFVYTFHVVVIWTCVAFQLLSFF